MNNLFRLIFRHLLNRGVNAGIDRALGPKPGRAPRTPAERAQAKAAKANARRAKQALRLARRVGRF